MIVLFCPNYHVIHLFLLTYSNLCRQYLKTELFQKLSELCFKQAMVANFRQFHYENVYFVCLFPKLPEQSISSTLRKEDNQLSENIDLALICTHLPVTKRRRLQQLHLRHHPPRQ